MSIEQRLRKGARSIYLATESIVADDVSDMMNKAADELASLRDQLAEAIRLLKPFAEISLEQDHDPKCADFISGDDLAITPRQVRRAREFIEGQDERA